MKCIIYKHVLPNGKTYVGIWREDSNKWLDSMTYVGHPEFCREIMGIGWDRIEHDVLCSGMTEMQALKKKNEFVKKLGYIYDHMYKMPKRKVSDEVKQRISESMPNKKPVKQYTLDGKFVARYESTRDAYKATGVRNDHISMACKGKLKRAGGFIWKYAK